MKLQTKIKLVLGILLALLFTLGDLTVGKGRVAFHIGPLIVAAVLGWAVLDKRNS